MQTPTHGAHPRSRGENRAKKAHPAFQKGSSPLTQGKHLVASARHAVEGPIPAHARKTRRTAEPSQRSPAHPRPRGENGSPRPLPRRRRAHPRSRGENGVALGNTLASAGSSPLTRGKPQRYYRGDLLPRLIPAHAGKTYGSHTRTVPSWAHPRSRGENASIDAKAAELGGSSPLTRGKRGLGGVPGVVDRLIPAHAGKTARPCARLIRWRAHPRSRGENIQTSSQTVKTSGSSPLTREKRRAGCIDGLVQRLIPAHAGKTDAARPERERAGAHPRSRGENDRGPHQACPD